MKGRLEMELGCAFCYCVLNGGEWLDYSLKSIVPLLNENYRNCIIIIEGSDQFVNPLETDKRGNSIDGTLDIIEKWRKQYPDRITHVRMGRVPDMRVMKNEMLKYKNDYRSSTEMVFIIDADEVYHTEHIRTMNDIMNENQDNFSLYFNRHIMFWGDFRTKYAYEEDDTSWFRETAFWHTQNLNYNQWHTWVSLNGKQPFHEACPATCYRVKNSPFFHYGYITSRRRFFMRRMRTYTQRIWYARNIEIDDKWNEKYVWKIMFNGQPFEEKHFNKLMESNDVHPEHMKKHPWYGLPKEEIWNWTNPYPTFFYED